MDTEKYLARRPSGPYPRPSFMPRRLRTSRYAASFGAIIRRLREQRQWTLLAFSRKAGMNPTYLGFLDRGDNSPTLDTVILLAQVLGAEASDILREMEQQK
jgi:DNA-binding XRE family transcriptional regulator